jgi:hypothetical protein
MGEWTYKEPSSSASHVNTIIQWQLLSCKRKRADPDEQQLNSSIKYWGGRWHNKEAGGTIKEWGGKRHNKEAGGNLKNIYNVLVFFLVF